MKVVDTIILLLSIATNLSVAIYGITLIRRYELKVAFYAIPLALFLMTIRRFIPLFDLLFSLGYAFDILNDGIGLVVSMLMLFGVIGINHLSIERMKANEKIQTLLSEKDLILKEVHHRIKNNINTIKAFLSLQAGEINDPAAIAALEDTERRLDSMMLLYEELYRSTSYLEVDAKSYLERLIAHIIENLPPKDHMVLETEIDEFMLDAKRLQAVAIIINELLCNTMKYAFNGQKEKAIKVMANITADVIAISIQDNGKGMPESIDFENSQGFGLILVKELTRQLYGEIRIERTMGTKIILEFSK
jgi:two-component sensor histidine kinase